MIDAGADVIVGAHPHITQGAEYYNNHLIVYSLGNFLFNGFDTDETQTGWALRLTLDKQGVVQWDTVVARLDPHGVPLPALHAKSPSGRRGEEAIVQRDHLPAEKADKAAE
jgi:poly-gamma-glutamate synthesis protein (capsule biosynthesis protein)